MRRPPGDDELRAVLAQVRLAPLLQRSGPASSGSNANGSAAMGLDCRADWAAMLSLGEQQRLAFGRCAFRKMRHFGKAECIACHEAMTSCCMRGMRVLRICLSLEASLVPAAEVRSIFRGRPVYCRADHTIWHFCLGSSQVVYIYACRILLSKPKLVLMDEATSALDIDNEERLYKLIADAGVTFVSVGHRPSLAAFHQKVLRISTGESQDAAESSKPAWELAEAA